MACTELNWMHDTNTPHRSDTGVVIERAVRRQGNATTMVQSGLPEE